MEYDADSLRMGYAWSTVVVMVSDKSKAPEDSDSLATSFIEKRRSVRVAATGFVEAGIALRTQSEILPVAVRDIGHFGMSIISDRPLAAALGERVFGVVSFFGTARHAPVRGALFRLTVRRRQPDLEGWLLGVEFADLRGSPWRGLVDWIDYGGGHPRVPVYTTDWTISWP